jgi:nitrogen regulatory protein P-II 1
MVKIEAIIQPFKLEDVKTTLETLCIEEFTISEVVAHGGPVANKAFFRGAEYCVDVPMFRLEMLVSSRRADEVIEALSRAASTTIPGDAGTIRVYELADAVRIRTRERLEFALP